MLNNGNHWSKGQSESTLESSPRTCLSCTQITAYNATCALAGRTKTIHCCSVRAKHKRQTWVIISAACTLLWSQIFLSFLFFLLYSRNTKIIPWRGGRGTEKQPGFLLWVTVHRPALQPCTARHTLHGIPHPQTHTNAHTQGSFSLNLQVKTGRQQRRGRSERAAAQWRHNWHIFHKCCT